MGKIFPDMMGALIGSVGKVSYYMRYSDNIARRKGEERKASDSPAAVEQRAKFGAVAHLSRMLRPAVGIGFPQRKRGLSPRNAFHQLNKDACSVEEKVIVVDYERVMCANGGLMVPEVTVTYNAATGKFLFEQESEGEDEGCNASDQVYAVLLERSLEVSRLVKLRARGESGSTSAVLPKRWNRDEVVVYVFAVSDDGKEASKSLYMEVEAGN